MKTYTRALGRINETEHRCPERTAYKQGFGLFPGYIFQVWPNRASMAKSIRMQQKRAPNVHDWMAVIRLSDGEGY